MPTINGTPNDDVLIGTAGADEIFGFDGNDIIDGGTGDDDMRGGQGNDVYVVRDANDFIVETNNQGEDIVYSAISYLMGTFVDGDSIETLSTIQHSDTTAIDLTATGDGTRKIIGNYGNNVLAGLVAGDYIGFFGDDTFDITTSSSAHVIENEGEGNDTVRVSGNSDYTLNAGASVETITVKDVNTTTAIELTGNEFTQTIIGNKGNNILDGGSGGNDIMIGGDGNDFYHVRRSGQVVTETAGGGTSDRIIAYIDFDLRTVSNIEVLEAAAGTAPLHLIGDASANFIYGNSGNNILDGSAGAVDTLRGGLGDDIYRVHNAGDVVQESAGGGTDTIYVHFSYTLGTVEYDPLAYVENLSSADHAGTESLNFTGNTLNNVIIGNYGANILDGWLGGDDTLYGLAGNDTYIVRNAGDQAIEQVGQGNDTVYAYASFALSAGSEVETLSTVSHAATNAIDLTGNEFGQTVVGNNGANVLDGKGGNDLLAGLGGADTFAFTSALGAGNVDTLFDFSAADDTIALDDAVFGGGLTPGALPAGAFVIGSAAVDGDDRIIYNSATGQLFFDADGSGVGAAVHFATLQGAPALTAADFVVI